VTDVPVRPDGGSRSDESAVPEARKPDGQPVAFDPARRPAPGEVALAVRKFLAIAAVALALVVAWLLRDLIIVAFVAALVASGMYGVVALLERWMPSIAAVAAAYAGLLAVLALGGLLIVPPFVDQAAQLVANLPTLLDDLRTQVSGLIDEVGGSGTGERMFEQLVPREPPPEALGVPVTMAQVLFNVAITVFLSALLLLERGAIRGWFSEFLLARDRGPVIDLAHTAVDKLGAYVRGQLVVMAITGVGTTAGMLLLGVPFALPMGLLGFFAEAIPLAGPFIVGVPVVLLALVDGGVGTALLMLGWFLVLQQLEGWFIYPIVQGRILALSPIVVLLAVMAGAALYGVLGAIIAVPLVAIGDVVLREIVFPLRRRESRRDAAVARSPTR
jgi:putative heme transporter